MKGTGTEIEVLETVWLISPLCKQKQRTVDMGLFCWTDLLQLSGPIGPEDPILPFLVFGSVAPTTIMTSCCLLPQA